jgi:hypothetical protein
MIAKNGMLEKSSTNYSNVGLSRLKMLQQAHSPKLAAGLASELE